MRSNPENDSIIRVGSFRSRSGDTREWLDYFGSFVPESRIIVIMSKRSVFSEQHLLSAVVHAARAISSANARARDPAIEVLRWLTGQRQVSAALEVSSPGGPSSVILVALIPCDIINGEVSHPQLEPLEWDGPQTPMLEPMAGLEWGGSSVIETLGLPPDTEEDERLKSVLEKVAMTDI